MAMSVKERQRKWQERQKNSGKKRLTVVVDPGAFSIMQREKTRTGESLSNIVSRALLNIDKKVSGNDIVGPPPDSVEAVSDNKKLKGGQLIERIVSLIGVVGLSAEEVAGRLNDERIEPPDYAKAWSAKTVNELYIRAITST